MTVIFDGVAFAQENEKKLASEVEKLRSQNVIPKLASFIIGDDPRALKYQQLKQKVAQSIGALVEIRQFGENESIELVKAAIEEANEDLTVHGVMIQLPHPKKFRPFRKDLIASISPAKDVDGMRDDSLFVAPVVQAIELALNSALVSQLAKKGGKLAICVVGGSGFVGAKTVRHLKKHKEWEVKGVDVEIANLSDVTRSTDVIISVTGKPNLITEDMVGSGAILIDVGAPIGEIDKSAYSKASFYTPVPGGIGPVTIFFLIKNLVSP